jgi:hypothetical protein
MSLSDEIIEENPDKYETILESRILGKQLQMKLNQYSAIQTQYNTLLQTENNNRKRSTGGWKRINGALKQISAVGKGWLWGVNNNNQIFTCRKPCNDSNWINIPGGLSQVEGGESEVWGVNAQDNIWKMNVDHSNGWRQISGQLSNISQGGGWVWGINRNNSVYRCQQPCNGSWILDTSPRGQTSLVQLSCSITHVYALDKNKNAWRKSINGSGSWSKFGNPADKQFNWINASNPDRVLAVGTDRHIYATNRDGTDAWYKADNQSNDIVNVSGDPENANYYVTNRRNAIYRHEPSEQGGYWTDLQNENYQTDMIASPTESTDSWKFLGKTDNLNDCKLKAVEDKNTTYSSVVYYPSDFGNDWNKSCFGGVKGKNINSNYQPKTITSLAPNGTTRLGGTEGDRLLKEMEKLQNEIKTLTDKAKESGIGLDQTNSLLSGEISSQNDDLDRLLNKLKDDREVINRIMSEPDETSGEEDSSIRQSSSYTSYALWMLLVIVSVYVAYHVYSREIYDISIWAYVFVAIWIVIILKQYYGESKEYGRKSWNYVSSFIPNIL